jgi:hypothetical protein
VKIKIKDAFGTDVGEAHVVWYNTGNKDAFMMDREVADVFEPVNAVLLPTRNTAMAWQLEVTP